MNEKNRMSYLHMTTSYGHTYAIHKTRLGHTARDGYWITNTWGAGCVTEQWGGTLEESIAKVTQKIAEAQRIFEVQNRDGDGVYLKETAA